MNNGFVHLQWKTVSETNNARFLVYRDGEVIASMDGAGSTSEPQPYTFTDQYVIPGQTYTYVLADVSMSNAEFRHDDLAVSLTVEEGDMAQAFTIGTAYPNPFNPVTVVPLNLMQDADVHVVLYNMLGRKVRDLQHGTLTAGSHALKVDGSALGTGIYFVHIRVNDATHVQKIALMK